MLLGKWQQIDTLAVGGAGQEMRLNYFADAGARIVNTAGFVAKGRQKGANERTVDVKWVAMSLLQVLSLY